MRLPLTLSVALAALLAQAQPGSVDLGFNPTDLTGGGADGLNGSCRTILVQPDGKVLVAGDFTICNGADRVRIARLNADGSLDASFDPGFGANDGIRALALQPDGKILVGGLFTYYNGAFCKHLVRLNPDGSRDESFDTGTGFDGSVFALALQPDGRMLVGGDFYHVDGNPGHGLVRLGPVGGYDYTYTPGDVGTVYSLALRPDGRCVVAGTFSFVGGVEHNGIAGLEADGTLDLSFAPLGWSCCAVFSVALQADGKVLAGGMFPGGLARFNTDGTPDESFGGGIGGFTGWDPWVFAVSVSANEQVVVAGRFTHYNGAACNGIARLNQDGTMDESFLTGEGFNSDVYTMVMQPDGKVLLGGFFDSVDGTPRNRIARLMSDDLSTAVADNGGSAFEVYPNPSTGMVWLRTEAARGASLSIIGPDGRIIEAAPIGATLQQLDLSTRPKGVYVVRLAMGASIHTERVVIQ